MDLGIHQTHPLIAHGTAVRFLSFETTKEGITEIGQGKED
jgi:hypothetical protein